MTQDNQKHFVELKVIWKDDEMFELSVLASSIDFLGRTEVYDQSESLSEFAKTLVDFPYDQNTLFYECGQKDSYAYFSMKYYPIGKSGLVGVEIIIESNVSTDYRPEEKSKLKLEIIVEPSAIDSFQKALYTMAKNENGTAILNGRDS